MTGPNRLTVVAVALTAGVALSVWMARLPAGLPGGDSGAPPAAAGSERATYTRVVCLSPAVTEIAFAIGAGRRVVGVSEFAHYPPEADPLPSCGGYFNPNKERIVALAPDLILSQGEATDLRRFGERNGIDVVAVRLADLDAILTAVDRLGEVLGLRERAAVVRAEMVLRLARVRARAAERPPVRAVLVLGAELDRLDEITAVGPGTFLSDLLEAAGGVNLLHDLAADYGTVSKEALIERAPDVVIELRGDSADPADATRQARERWAGLGVLPAVARGRVYAVTSTCAMVPGPRVVELAERMLELLHGEAD